VPDMLVCSQTHAGCEPYDPTGSGTASPMILTKNQCKTFCQGGGGAAQFQYTCLGTMGEDNGSNYCASVPPTGGPVGVSANRFNSLRGCERPCYSEMPNPIPDPGPSSSQNFQCAQGGFCVSGSYSENASNVYTSIDECLAECQ
jgi:hypothetical protein